MGRHFGGFLAEEGIDIPALVADPDSELRGLALRFLGYLRQWRTRSGRPLAPSSVGLVQTTVSGFTPSWPTGAPRPPMHSPTRDGPS